MKREKITAKEGSTLIIVVITMAFIGILATIVLSLSSANYKMKVTERKSKSNFYSAEIALDEIKANFESEVSLIIESAYEKTLQDYIALDSTTRNQLFREEVVKNIIASFDSSIRNVGDAGSGTYTCDKIATYLDKTKENTIIDSTSNIIEWKNSKYNRSERYVCIKDIIITYTNSQSYQTNIKTDLQVEIPSLNFDALLSNPEFTEYAIVAQEQFLVKNYTANVEGNVFAGKGGITVTGDTANVFLKNNRTITSGNIEVSNNGFLSIGPEAGKSGDTSNQIWTTNIETVGKTGGKIDLSGTFYVANDLVFNAEGSEAVLTGDYYGYGYGKNSNQSSAIIVNRAKSKMDLSGINRLFLLGRSYISPNESHSSEGAEEEDGVLTGESISIKGNQIVYLLPGECIGVGADGKVIGNNPITSSQYTELVHGIDGVKEVDMDYVLPFNGKKISDYAKGYRTIFDSTSTGTFVYYYLDFKSEQLANQYFKDCYEDKNNSGYIEKLKKSLKNYSSSIIAPKTINQESLEHVVSGNMVFSTGNEIKQFVYSKQGQIDTSYKEEADKLQQDYQSLSATLSIAAEIENQQDIEQYKENLFEYIIVKSTEMEEYPGLLQLLNGSRTKKGETDYGDYMLVNNPTETYVIDSSIDEKVKIVIATGDVCVRKDFAGLILCGGTLQVENNVTIQSATAQVSRIILKSELRTVFRELRQYSILVEENTNNRFTVRDLVTTKNWKSY